MLPAIARRTENQIRGDELENRVLRLFKGLGKWNVKKNLTLVDKYGTCILFLISSFEF